MESGEHRLRLPRNVQEARSSDRTVYPNYPSCSEGAANRSVCGAAGCFWDKVLLWPLSAGRRLHPRPWLQGAVMTRRLGPDVSLRTGAVAQNDGPSTPAVSGSVYPRIRLIFVSAVGSFQHINCFSSLRSLDSTGVISMLLHPAECLT